MRARPSRKMLFWVLAAGAFVLVAMLALHWSPARRPQMPSSLLGAGASGTVEGDAAQSAVMGGKGFVLVASPAIVKGAPVYERAIVRIRPSTRIQLFGLPLSLPARLLPAIDASPLGATYLDSANNPVRIQVIRQGDELVATSIVTTSREKMLAAAP